MKNRNKAHKMPKELFLTYRLLERGKHVMLIIYNEELSSGNS